MLPYRSPREERAAPAAPPPGLVADMVQQFADPYAFLRELVQNGMDAGARRISVRVERLPDGVAMTSVSDDGSGMSREIIEGPLLTLFSTSKEGDDDKIGKYGVGFVSVFALQPELVEVETWCASPPRQAWMLRLHGDCSYELAEAAPRDGGGTRVSLIQRMSRDAFAEHAARTRKALARWCRHADCAIELWIGAHEATGEAKTERIDAPLSIAAAVSVTAVYGDTTIVVGSSATAGAGAGAGAGAQQLDDVAGSLEHLPRFAGFYNRGLTLFETTDEVFAGLSGVRFKVMSRRLQHTLSRDNVRRDDAFWEALARVRELARGPLRRELAARLGPAATALAAGGDAATYVAMLEAALSPETALDPDEIAFPLASPLGGDRARAGLKALAPAREPLLVAAAPDALTEALARSGRPVILCGHPAVAGLLKRCFSKRRIEEARAVYLLVRATPRLAGDEALLDVVAKALARARHPVHAVTLCALDGALPERAAVLTPPWNEAAPQLCSAREIERSAARWTPSHALCLNVGSETVTLARRRAALDPVTAGHLLARALLVEAKGPLDADDSDRLLDLGGAR